MLTAEQKALIEERFAKYRFSRENFATLTNVLTAMAQYESAFISVTRQHIMDTTGEESLDVLSYLADIDHIITEEDIELLPELSKETPVLCTPKYLEQAEELIGLPLTDECLQMLIDKKTPVALLRYWTYIRNHYVKDLPRVSDNVIEQWERHIKSELRALEYDFGEVWGVWEDEKERSFFVVNIHNDPNFYENIFSLASEYNQDSFIYLKNFQRDGSCEGEFVNTNNNVRKDNTKVEQNEYMGYMESTPFSKLIIGNNTIEIRIGTQIRTKFIITEDIWDKNKERWIDRKTARDERKAARRAKLEERFAANPPVVVAYPHKRHHSRINDDLLTREERFERAERKRRAYAKLEGALNENFKKRLQADMERRRLARNSH